MGAYKRARAGGDVYWISFQVEGSIAPKTICNVHAVLSTMLQQARFEGLVDDNAARALPRGILPAKKTRGGPPYSREELGVLLGHPSVPDDGRMLLALMGLGGLRLGEACGRRWRDVDTTAKPLWCLHVHDQYDGQPLKTAELGDAKERWVPVHPLLQELLVEWYQRGFESQLGRAPRPEDPISPWPARMAPRTEHQGGNAVERAIAGTGVPRLPGRRAHSLRRSFISLARSDGARQDVLERVTHNSAGAMIDAYTWMGWDALCEAVAVLRVERLKAMPADAAAHSPELGRGGGAGAGVERLAGLRG